MSAARRARIARTVFEQVGRWQSSDVVLVVECLRVVSRCDGRPDLWEWRTRNALTSRHIVGTVYPIRNPL